MNLVGENLSYKLTEELQLRKISFNFEKGKLYTILGRTLSGKTTLLKTIAGLLMPDSGSIRFEDKNFLEIPVWKRNIAMVYQQFINYPHLNVFDNIAFPLKQRGLDPQKINDEVFKSLRLVGLEGYEKRKIQELSGGQQQRVSVARSLVKNAKILLLDEPLVNLDYKLREQLREEFKNIFVNGLSEESIVIFSTTDPREAMELNGEVIVLDEGRVLQVGAAKEIFENPKNLKVAAISNDPPMNILKAEIDSNKIKFENIEIDINEKDLRIDTYRSSGAGGQHVNTTDSAVRITHLPSKIVVQCQNERSQHKNKDTCLNMLKARLYDFELKKKEKESQTVESSKSEIGWGHQIRSYVLHPYRMVKDNRTNFESSNPDKILDGEIDDFLESSLYKVK